MLSPPKRVIASKIPLDTLLNFHDTEPDCLVGNLVAVCATTGTIVGGIRNLSTRKRKSDTRLSSAARRTIARSDWQSNIG